MNQKLLWRFLLVALVVSWSVNEFLPPKARDLGVEFKRRALNPDATFTNILDRFAVLEKDSTNRTFANLAEAVGTNSIPRYFPFVNVKTEKDPNRAVLYQLQRDASGRIKLGLDLQGGMQFLMVMDTNKLGQAADKDRVLGQAVEVLRKRVDAFGVAEPILQPVGSDRILVQLPGLSESQKESAKNQLSRAAVLEFRLVHPQSATLVEQGIIEPGYEILKTEDRMDDGSKALVPFLVKKKPERGLTGTYVKTAMVVRDPLTGVPEIHFEMTTEGAVIFADVTRQNIGQRLAIILDGELYSAPVIQSEIPNGSGRITLGQNFDPREAFDLANVLVNPLEAKLTIEEERSVDPSLGADSIRSGVRATIIGTALVALFMAAYYLFAGLVADFALVLNIIILMGVMCSFEATLTLPGIAGIVLTAGMAVDANVLIFERIREELVAGKSMRGALAAGYDKAFGTIFDSNLTTMISSVILIFLGTGSVKGFGISLTIGIAASMFTALLVTRLVFDFMLARGWLKSMPMLQMVRVTKIDFLRWAPHAFATSWLLIIVGIAYGFYRGPDALGVDFKGGDALTLRFAQRVDVGQLRSTITGSLPDAGSPQIGYGRSLVGAADTLQIVTQKETALKVESLLKEKFPQARFERIGVDIVGPTVGREIQESALISVFLSLLGILVYVAFRYEFSFAVGAVVAIFHDVLMTLGWYFLTGRQLDAGMVAAILTIIGFSINDTIVIFDRIREDLKLGVRGSFRDVMNIAMNQTLSRTIITSGTVFLATMALYVFGGDVINDFAFTFLVGILTGCYSTIYIASALVLWWNKGERPKLASQVVMEAAAPGKA